MLRRSPWLPATPICHQEEQQAVLAFHRIRERIIKERIHLTNELHGLLGEFGFALPKGYSAVRRTVAKIMSEAHLPPLLQEAVANQ
jgi:transposase